MSSSLIIAGTLDCTNEGCGFLWYGACPMLFAHPRMETLGLHNAAFPFTSGLAEGQEKNAKGKGTLKRLRLLDSDIAADDLRQILSVHSGIKELHIFNRGYQRRESAPRNENEWIDVVEAETPDVEVLVIGQGELDSDAPYLRLSGLRSLQHLSVDSSVLFGPYIDYKDSEQAVKTVKSGAVLPPRLKVLNCVDDAMDPDLLDATASFFRRILSLKDSLVPELESITFRSGPDSEISDDIVGIFKEAGVKVTLSPEN